MEKVSGGESEVLGKFGMGMRKREKGERDKSEAEELVVEVVAGTAEHPDFALEDGVTVGDREVEELVEVRVLATTFDDLSGESVVRGAGEGELGVDVLVSVDADVVDVASLVDVDVKHGREGGGFRGGISVGGEGGGGGGERVERIHCFGSLWLVAGEKGGGGGGSCSGGMFVGCVLLGVEAMGIKRSKFH